MPERIKMSSQSVNMRRKMSLKDRQLEKLLRDAFRKLDAQKRPVQIKTTERNLNSNAH